MSTESVREKILEAALEKFSQNGYQGTSIDEIASACGMKAPNIYKYFKGKEAILDAIANMSIEGYMNRMNMTPDSLIWIHNSKELKIFTMHQMKYTINNDRIRKIRKMCAIEQFRSEKFGRQLTEHQMENIQKLYEKIFSELIEFGEIRDGDVAMMAMEYYAPISLLIQLCDREPEREEEVFEKIERYIDFFIEKTFIKK